MGVVFCVFRAEYVKKPISKDIKTKGYLYLNGIKFDVMNWAAQRKNTVLDREKKQTAGERQEIRERAVETLLSRGVNESRLWSRSAKKWLRRHIPELRAEGRSETHQKRGVDPRKIIEQNILSRITSYNTRDESMDSGGAKKEPGKTGKFAGQLWKFRWPLRD